MTREEELEQTIKLAGRFGWVWLISGGLAILFLIMAIGFGSSWVPFVIAAVVGGVASWQARVLNDRRKTLEAEQSDDRRMQDRS